MVSDDRAMTYADYLFKRHRFDRDMILLCVRWYVSYKMSYRDLVEMMTERGWWVCTQPSCTGLSDVKINGERQYLWRAVDQDGDVVDILVQSRRNKQAALRFFRKMLKGQGQAPRKMVTDKLRSYGAARNEIMPSVMHCQDQYANNGAEVSHRQSRQQERQMRRFKSSE